MLAPGVLTDYRQCSYLGQGLTDHKLVLSDSCIVKTILHTVMDSLAFRFSHDLLFLRLCPLEHDWIPRLDSKVAF